MKYLNRQPKPDYLKYEPYSIEEIDNHENSERIWSTLMAIRAEAQEQIRRAYDNGYADGKFDRDVKDT